jgi:3-phenylpropionate/cinnamic acid dioxygenase small subunit
VNEALHFRVQQFLFLEARLQDTHAYDEWEALWADDATYWVPANGDDIDPEKQMSVLYDNRSRISMRVEQLKTGRRYTQTPRSRLARSISNIEIVAHTGTEITVLANMFICEESLRGQTLWAARNEYILRDNDQRLELVRKKVVLVNNDRPMPTLSFLV